MKRIISTIIFTVLVSTFVSAQEPDSSAVFVPFADSTMLSHGEAPLPEPLEYASADTVMNAAAAVQEEDEPVLSREEMLVRAEALKQVYDFTGARALYDKVLLEEADSAEIARIVALKVQVDNGIGMMEYVMEPSVIARQRFSRRDFFLFYPVPDGSWVMSPNTCDPDGKAGMSAMYVPADAQKLVWSRNDAGYRNIYISEKKDTVWTNPVVPRDELSTDGSEIWPVLSADGKSIYFSSNGLYGVGGYDLYVTKYNERTGEWGVPQNLGFPFSSPGDDLLYMDTPDEKYTVFASNRACSTDSVDVYVLAYEQVPVRKEVKDPVRLCGIASLTPDANQYHMDNGDSTSEIIEEDAEVRRYMDKMEEVRMLRDSLSVATRELNERRVEFATSDDEDLRARLTEEILKRELTLPELQSASSKALSELQEIELDFLFKGVVIDPDKLMKKADREVVGDSAAYTFSKMQPGTLPEIVFEVPEPVIEAPKPVYRR